MHMHAEHERALRQVNRNIDFGKVLQRSDRAMILFKDAAAITAACGFFSSTDCRGGYSNANQGLIRGVVSVAVARKYRFDWPHPFKQAAAQTEHLGSHGHRQKDVQRGDTKLLKLDTLKSHELD